MIDRQRGVGELQPGKRAQGDSLTQAADEEKAAQRLWVLQMFGCQFHHHPVLVERVVDHTDLALAERVIERGVNRAHGEAHARGGITVDHQRGLQATVLLVGVDVHQFRQGHHGAANARVPDAQVFQVVTLQRVLVLRVGLAPANAYVLHRNHEEVGARLLGQLGAQPRHHLIGRSVALGQWLERHEHLGRIALRAAREPGDVFDRRVGFDDGQKAVQPQLHGLK